MTAEIIPFSNIKFTKEKTKAKCSFCDKTTTAYIVGKSNKVICDICVKKCKELMNQSTTT